MKILGIRFLIVYFLDDPVVGRDNPDHLGFDQSAGQPDGRIILSDHLLTVLCGPCRARGN